MLQPAIMEHVRLMKQSNSRDYLRVGITGGIGSGKTLACEMFKKLGRVVFFADVMAHEIMNNDRVVKESLRKSFGPNIYDANGKLRRQDLANIVFEKPRSLRTLNTIVHPRVMELLEQETGALPASKRQPYVIVEAALIFESELHKSLDYIVTVNASEESQISRTMARDGTDREKVLARIHSQMPASEKVELSDIVIDNNGTLAELNLRVQFVNSLLTSLARTQ